MKYNWLLGATVILLMSGCSKDVVITKIGSDKLTKSMIEERIRQAPLSYAGFLSTEAGKKQFLDLIIRERLVIEAAKDAGFGKSKEYKKSIADFKEDQKKRLKDFEDGQMMELFVMDLHKKRISASDDEVENYYADNKKDFDSPVEITAQHILANTMEEAVAIRKRLMAGENFAKLAKEVSKDTVSAESGGKIGPFRKGELVPEFENAVFPLNKGQVSDIVKTQFGYHIIKKTEEKLLPKMSENDAKAQSRNIIQKIKFDKWLEEAKEKYKVKTDYKKLAAINIKPSLGLEESQLLEKAGAIEQ